MILLIDNYDSFTYNVKHYLMDLNEKVSVVRNDKISIKKILKLNPKCIVISPGPCTPNEAGISLNLVSELSSKFPILGICLGHQTIGQAFGGNIIKCKNAKSRLTKENSTVETRLFYDRGLDRYYGLLELGEKYGVFPRKGNRVVVGESSVYPSAILADPGKYFTEEIMQKLDEAAAREFRYGN